MPDELPDKLPLIWDIAHAEAKFTFNNMQNRSVDNSPFEIVYGCVPKHTLNLVPLPKFPDLSIAVEKMADRIVMVHAEVQKKLYGSNAKFKKDVDKHRRQKVFEVGDNVLDHLCGEGFSTGMYNKLKNKKIDLVMNFRKINNNAYVVDLPEGMEISLTFNVAEFYEYHEPSLLNNLMTSSFQAEGIDVGRDTCIVSMAGAKEGQMEANVVRQIQTLSYARLG